MRRRRSQRGGAYLYVIVCVSVMGLLLVNIVPYVAQARNIQSRRAKRARVELATEALVQQVVAEATVQPVPASAIRSLTLNGATATVTVTDGSTVVPNSYFLSGIATLDGKSTKIFRHVSQGIGATPYSFAVYSATDMDWAGKLVTGAAGANGDVFSNGKIKLDSVSGTTINGNLSANKKITLSGGSVTGGTFEDAPAVAMPTVSALNYQANSSYTLFGNQAFTGGASFTGTVNGHYPINYVGGNISFQGAISGIGVVFVNGSVTVTGNLTYANASSRVAVITTGNVTINPGVSQIVGTLYVGGSFIDNSPDLNVTRGSIVANKILSGAIIRATRDNFLQTSSTEGVKMCLPGYWP